MRASDHAGEDEAQDARKLEAAEQQQDPGGQAEDDDEFPEEWEVHGLLLEHQPHGCDQEHAGQRMVPTQGLVPEGDQREDGEDRPA